MKRTIALKLLLEEEQIVSLEKTQEMFSEGCNFLVQDAKENRCWNSVALHHLSYYRVRGQLPQLGSQMVCNAIRKVCGAYKALKIRRKEEVPSLSFRRDGSIHYCARTFTLKGEILSLFTVCGRIKCDYVLGDKQRSYLDVGKVKEGELIRKGKRWFFNLVLDIPDVPLLEEGSLLAVDMGENNLATTSNGTIHGGGSLRHKRDRFLARRAKLQSNGSKSAKRCLKRISGRERRHVKEVNHIVSKKIIEEAIASGVKTIVLEKLTNIRKRIRGNKRMRSRLHRWSWYELQKFVEYKAQAAGISIKYVNPAYSSQVCSQCEAVGSRQKHQFSCQSCGSYQHSDRNASINLLKLGESAVSSMAPVNVPMVAAI